MKISFSLPTCFGRALLLLLLLCFLSCLTACESKEDKFSRLYEKALQYKTKQRWEEARITFRSALEANPLGEDAYFQLGEVLVRQKQFRKAAEAYSETLNVNPAHRQARLNLAALMLAARQFEMADSGVRILLEKDPEDLEALLLKANLARVRDDAKQAGEILERLIAKEPDHPVVMANLAALRLLEGNVASAEELFIKASKIAPENSAVKLALGSLYASSGRFEEAREVFEALAEERSENSALLVYYAEFLTSLGLMKEATQRYQETLQVDPLRHDARDKLYDILVAKNKKAEAKKLTAELIAFDKFAAGRKYFMGRDAELERKKREALDLYIEAIPLLNNFAPAFRRTGLLELSFGKRVEALEHLNQAIALDASDPGARMALSRDAFLRSDFGVAMEHVEKILSKYPRHLNANILKADVLTQEGKTKLAQAIYQRLFKVLPNSPMGAVKMALVAEKNKDTQGAITWYKKSLEYDKNILPAAKRLVHLLSAQGSRDSAIQELTRLKEKSEKQKPEYEYLIASLMLLEKKSNVDNRQAARDMLSKAIEDRPSLIGAYAVLADLDKQSGDWPAAAQKYQKILEQKPKHIPTLMLLAMTYETLGKDKEAIERYEEVMRLSPRFGPAANNLAWLLSVQDGGNLDEAVRLAQIAKEQLPRTGHVADTLGWIYYKRGQFRAALSYVKEALQLEKQFEAGGEPNAEMLYHLGLIQQSLEDKKAAREAFTGALDAGGSDYKRSEEIKALLKKNH